MSELVEQSLGQFTSSLAQRIPAPGGGAAAGAVAAMGCALAAMSARYTSGKRFSEDALAAAQNLALLMDEAASICLNIGEEDAKAYAQVQVLRKEKASEQDIAGAEEPPGRCHSNSCQHSASRPRPARRLRRIATNGCSAISARPYTSWPAPLAPPGKCWWPATRPSLNAARGTATFKKSSNLPPMAAAPKKVRKCCREAP